MQITKVLVANRGEIAARVFRTLTETGRQSVAIYATPDRGSAWSQLADEAIHLPGESAAETYLNGPEILRIAQERGAQAIHPGYGFLSENPEFAAQVVEAGLIWLGPSAAAITALGDKAEARALAQSLNVGTIPGTNEPVRTWAEIRAFAQTAGYPILLKDPAGGGGRGIRELADLSALIQLAADQGVKLAAEDAPDQDSWGQQIGADSALRTSFLEKRLVGARHIETQCLRDQAGNFWLASTRDCSVQRRNQKLIEEAPAFLPPHTETQLREWSEKLFQAVDYVGAGTCEYLVDKDGNAYFLEVNPRLQVEHTVTEAVTGTDLVALQLAIAEGQALPQVLPADPTPRGHALQLRITSEDPARGLLPTGGTVSEIKWPAGPGIRIDAALAPGETIPTAFDSLIAKLIISAPTRQQAVARALRALSELQIAGVPNSASLYTELLSDATLAGDPQQIHTRWLESTHLDPAWREAQGLPATPSGTSGMAAEATDTAGQHVGPANAAGQQIGAANAAGSATSSGPAESAPTWAEIQIELGGKLQSLAVNTVQLREALGLCGVGGQNLGGVPVQPVRRARRNTVGSAGGNAGGKDNAVTAPMPATLMKLPVEVGQNVQAGELVALIEAMKMEQPLYAPKDGVVSEILAQVGDSLSSGQTIITLADQTKENATDEGQVNDAR
ncbi:hypothetical protein BSR28_06455 [Boudabousia liubingyangii]|uniref:ATP-binding protein n=1 Tax=Boudabousia liubingyangii TaxID=1921764 RepID=UPI00093B18F0|nr:biotin carboxylase N-terminal domain-containing protein [Boudabousia liubingyangii]OKL47047.1 hypothetical protein BSR28_06455 [Boudabousia liubingyangii]